MQRQHVLTVICTCGVHGAECVQVVLAVYQRVEWACVLDSSEGTADLSLNNQMD